MIAVSSGAWAWRRPLCSTALRAATMPNWAARSVAVAVPVDMYWRGSKSTTWAIWVKRTPGWPAGAVGKGPMGAIPVMPEKSEWRKSSTVLPMGVTQPKPVITTRFTSTGSPRSRAVELRCGHVGWRLVFAELVDAAYDVAYGLEGAECVVWDFNIEGFFDFEGDVDLIERVNVELLEGGVEVDRVGRDVL